MAFFDFPNLPGLTPRPEPFSEGFWPCVLFWHKKNSSLLEKLNMLTINLRSGDGGFCILGFENHVFKNFVSYPTQNDLDNFSKIIIVTEHHLILIDGQHQYLWPCLFQMNSSVKQQAWDWIRDIQTPTPKSLKPLLSLPVPQNSKPAWILPTDPSWSTILIEACGAFEALTQSQWKNEASSWLQITMPRLTAWDTITNAQLRTTDGTKFLNHHDLSEKFNVFLKNLILDQKITLEEASGVAWNENHHPKPLMLEPKRFQTHLHQTHHFYLKTLKTYKPYLPDLT